MGLGFPAGLEMGLGFPAGLEMDLGFPAGLEMGLGFPAGLKTLPLFYNNSGDLFFGRFPPWRNPGSTSGYMPVKLSIICSKNHIARFILNDLRKSLLPENVVKLLFLHHNLLINNISWTRWNQCCKCI